MHTALISYFRQTLSVACSEVIDQMHLGMSDDDVYEAAVGNEEVLRDFRAAVRHMIPSYTSQDHAICLNGEALVVRFRMAATEKYPVRLLSLDVGNITPESKLGQALAEQISVAKAWWELEYVTERILSWETPVEVQAFLLPWLAMLAKDCPYHNDIGRVGSKAEQLQVKRELARIAKGVIPKDYPTRSKALTAICRSGNMLFGQREILRSAPDRQRRASLVIRNHHFSSEVMQADIAECMSSWINDQIISTIEELL